MKKTVKFEPPPLDFNEVLLQYHPSSFEQTIFNDSLTDLPSIENQVEEKGVLPQKEMTPTEQAEEQETNEDFPQEEELPILDRLKNSDQVLLSRDLFYFLSEGKIEEANKLIEDGADNSFHHSEVHFSIDKKNPQKKI